MKRLTQFLEELPVGVIHDPHTDQTIHLTESVTVCPACRGLNSLRREEEHVRCVECEWGTTDLEPVHAM
ncbi:MAG: hypothetical protein ACYDBB_17600 [Armatimonadota bacterium]